MSDGPWTDSENDLIVADYFAMLADDIAGRPYNKAEHRRGLLPLLKNRSEGSVEYKHQNISAVLKGFGESWIPGYKPAFNYQMTLEDAVARWLTRNPAWLSDIPGVRSTADAREAPQIWIGPPPTLSNQPPPQELEQMQHIARRFDVAGRHERIATSVAPVRSAYYCTRWRYCAPRGAMTWRARCAGCRRKMATARAMTSQVSRRMDSRA